MRVFTFAAVLALELLAACATGASDGNTTFDSFTGQSASASASAGTGPGTTSGTGTSDGSGAGSGTGASGTGASSGGPSTGASSGGPAQCGDGMLSGSETCDGMEFGGQTCADFGFMAGDLICSGTCKILTDGCFTCGDGTKQTVEACDGQDFGGKTCQTEGFAGGTLQCAVDCSAIGTSNCMTAPTCGNGSLDPGEGCDGASLGGKTCQTEGFDSGTLSCNADCTLNTSQCQSDPGCAGQGEPCIFDQNDPQSNCCPPGVKGNVLGICDLVLCI